MSQFELFPSPRTPASLHSPAVWGTNPASTVALQSVLKDNHERWHIFFNDKGFHNHASHHALALWALGASASVIDAAYAEDSKEQRAAFESPEPITKQNFDKHLGDPLFYTAYRKFFTDAVMKKGMKATVEEYIFHPGKNHTSNSSNKKLEMLARLLDSLLHPLIHVGYGFEFNIPGMVVEGLSMAAVHEVSSSAIIPSSFFQPSSSLVSRLVGLSFATKPEGNIHAFTILARMLKDADLESKTRVDQFGDILLKHTSEWLSADTSDPAEVTKKMEELVWLNTILYGVTGWKRRGEDFFADFVLMHLVTSSLFLSSTLAQLTVVNQVILLRSYFNVCLEWWLACGRPNIDIESFFNDDTSYPRPPGPFPTPADRVLPSPESADALTPNPWLPILETTIVHVDDHLPKLQRSLAHYASLYGSTPSGHFDTELAGSKLINGSLFIRVAGLTAKRMGRVRYGEEPLSFWDMYPILPMIKKQFVLSQNGRWSR